MKSNKINVFFSTLNFVLCFVGYPLATALFLPNTSDIENVSMSVTVPYRAFALLIAILVIIINFKKSSGLWSIPLKVFLFFWGILILRIFYDVFFIDSHLIETSQLWLYIFGICLPSVFSVIKSYKFIDLENSFYLIISLTTLVLILSLFTNQNIFIESDERQDANLAFNTIQFGNFGASAIILGIFALLSLKLNLFKKFITTLIICIGFFCMLRSGSRGPVIQLVFVLSYLLFFKSGHLFKGALVLFVAIVLGIVFLEEILNFLGNISPLIEDRLRSAIYEGDTSDRDPLYKTAFDFFSESPIVGKQFAFFESDGTFLYSHNIILDSLMGLGIIGFTALIYFLGSSFKISNYLMINKYPNYWINLLLIQQIIYNMFSSAFYYNQLLSALLVFLFISFPEIKSKKYNL